jgi:hypothetical protein
LLFTLRSSSLFKHRGEVRYVKPCTETPQLILLLKLFSITF